jgi:hypothetical protein
MQSSKSYVHVDEHGVMRVGNSRVMLDSVVASFEQGYSPETGVVFILSTLSCGKPDRLS